MDQWLEAASRCMDAAKEPLNAFHWDTRRMMTTDDLIAQLRSASISHQVLEAAKPSLEQVRCWQIDILSEHAQLSAAAVACL